MAFEILVCSRRHLSTLLELTVQEQSGLASILKQVSSTYDRVFEVPFRIRWDFIRHLPTKRRTGVALHAHFYPPLLRSAKVRKFMVGFEMLGTPQRDITAETAAERLRSLCARAE